MASLHRQVADCSQLLVFYSRTRLQIRSILPYYQHNALLSVPLGFSNCFVSQLWFHECSRTERNVLEQVVTRESPRSWRTQFVMTFEIHSFFFRSSFSNFTSRRTHLLCHCIFYYADCRSIGDCYDWDQKGLKVVFNAMLKYFAYFIFARVLKTDLCPLQPFRLFCIWWNYPLYLFIFFQAPVMSLKRNKRLTTPVLAETLC